MKIKAFCVSSTRLGIHHYCPSQGYPNQYNIHPKYRCGHHVFGLNFELNIPEKCSIIHAVRERETLPTLSINSFNIHNNQQQIPTNVDRLI